PSGAPSVGPQVVRAYWPDTPREFGELANAEAPVRIAANATNTRVKRVCRCVRSARVFMPTLTIRSRSVGSYSRQMSHNAVVIDDAPHLSTRNEAKEARDTLYPD